MSKFAEFAIQTAAGVVAVLLAQYLINNVRTVRRFTGSF